MSDSQKIENSLNLALNATDEERKKSMNLDVGYNQKSQMWEIIVKYSGESKEIFEGYLVANLLNEYAIVQVPENQIEELVARQEVEYVEKPKRLYFQRDISKIVSCVNRVQTSPLGLSGQGVIVGILDSGIDYKLNEFRNQDGKTRILNIWDQTIQGIPPKGYYRGTEYSQEEINELSALTKDVSGHGTEVASVAVGAGGVAFGADIIAVKLGAPQEGGFSRTTELMQGLDYVVRKAGEYRQPLVVNISFGNTYGSHEGNSLLERFIDDISNYGKTTICIGMGNEGNSAGHIQGYVKEEEEKIIELVVDRNQLSFDLQLWKSYEDTIEIVLESSSGERIGSLEEVSGTSRFTMGKTEILLYYGEPSPHSVLQEIFIEFIGEEMYVDSGIWKLKLFGRKIVTGQYNLWLPSKVVLNEGTGFNESVAKSTVTIPATASKAISVGAYNGKTMTYADFSGRGTSEEVRLVKPDIVAPGVGIQVVTSGGNLRSVSGTSYATPFVAGGAALLMEWGIVRGNDPYLYGEKVKSYLRKSAKPIQGYDVYPNELVGYGKLCIAESILV